MRAHKMDGNVIANTIEVSDLSVIPGLVDAAIGGRIGDSIIDGIVIPKMQIATRDELKVERKAKVDAIKVTTSANHTFDGDEVSQDRMARAIIALQATGTPTVTWVLADNTPAQIGAAELTEALALAGAAQAAVWVIQ